MNIRGVSHPLVFISAGNCSEMYCVYNVCTLLEIFKNEGRGMYVQRARIGANRQVLEVYRKKKMALKVEILDNVPVGVKLCLWPTLIRIWLTAEQWNLCDRPQNTMCLSSLRWSGYRWYIFLSSSPFSCWCFMSTENSGHLIHKLYRLRQAALLFCE